MNNESLDQILEKSLTSEPIFSLSQNFAARVTRAVVRHEQWRTDLREYFFYTAVVLVLISIVGGFYCFVDTKFMLNAISYLKDNWVSVAIVTLLLNFILFADKVLLRLLFNHWNLKL